MTLEEEEEEEAEEVVRQIVVFSNALSSVVSHINRIVSKALMMIQKVIFSTAL